MIVTWEGKREYGDPRISLGDLVESGKLGQRALGIVHKWWKSKPISEIIPFRLVEFNQVRTITHQGDDENDDDEEDNSNDDDESELETFKECYCLITFMVDCQMNKIKIKSIKRPKNELVESKVVTSWIPLKRTELESPLSSSSSKNNLWSLIQKDMMFPVHFQDHSESFHRVVLFINHRSLEDVKCYPPYALYRQDRIILNKRLKLYDFICQEIGHRDPQLVIRMTHLQTGCICLKMKCTNLTDCLRSLGRRIHEFQTKEEPFGKGEQLWSIAGRNNDIKGFFWVMLLSLYDPHMFQLVMFCEVILTLYKMVVFGWTEADQLRIFEYNNFSSPLSSTSSSNDRGTSTTRRIASPFWCRSNKSGKFNKVHQMYLSENLNRIGYRQHPRWFLHIPIPMLSSFDLNHVVLDEEDEEESTTSSLFDRKPPMAIVDYTCSYAVVCSLTLNMIRNTVDGLQQSCLRKAVENCNLIPSLSIEKKTSRGYSLAVGNHKKLRSGARSPTAGGGEDIHHRESSLGGTRVYNLIVLRSMFIREINRIVDRSYPLFELNVVKTFVYNRVFYETISLPKRLTVSASSGGGGVRTSRMGILGQQQQISDLPPGYEEFEEMLNTGKNSASLYQEDGDDDNDYDDSEREDSPDLFPPCVARLVDRKDGHPKFKERFFVLSFLFDVGLSVPAIAQIYKTLFKEKQFSSLSLVEFYKRTEYGSDFKYTMKNLQKYKKESGYPHVGNTCCNLVANNLCVFSSSTSGTDSCVDIEDLGQNYSCIPSTPSSSSTSTTTIRRSNSSGRQGTINDCLKRPKEHKDSKMMCAMTAARETGKKPRALFRRPVDCYIHKDAVLRDREQEETDHMKGVGLDEHSD